MSRTYKHIQKGKCTAEARVIWKEMSELPRNSEERKQLKDQWVKVWKKYDKTSFGMSVSRRYSWTIESILDKQALIEKILDRELKKQLENYYDDNLSGDTSSRGW